MRLAYSGYLFKKAFSIAKILKAQTVINKGLMARPLSNYAWFIRITTWNVVTEYSEANGFASTLTSKKKKKKEMQ